MKPSISVPYWGPYHLVADHVIADCSDASAFAADEPSGLSIRVLNAGLVRIRVSAWLPAAVLHHNGHECQARLTLLRGNAEDQWVEEAIAYSTVPASTTTGRGVIVLNDIVRCAAGERLALQIGHVPNALEDPRTAADGSLIGRVRHRVIGVAEAAGALELADHMTPRHDDARGHASKHDAGAAAAATHDSTHVDLSALLATITLEMV